MLRMFSENRGLLGARLVSMSILSRIKTGWSDLKSFHWWRSEDENLLINKTSNDVKASLQVNEAICLAVCFMTTWSILNGSTKRDVKSVDSHNERESFTAESFLYLIKSQRKLWFRMTNLRLDVLFTSFTITINYANFTRETFAWQEGSRITSQTMFIFT